MAKTIIVSNRMSTSVTRSADGFVYQPSVGGLATGLSTLHQQEGSLWIGWSGLPADSLSSAERDEVASALLDKHKCAAVDLTQEEIDAYYLGFCNDIIWPLFHYFPTYPTYDSELWLAYQSVNQKFFDVVREHLEPGDLIWVQDYQLMLLPALIKEAEPDSSVGFFLHIPFPSYELFRLLPWREEVLEGLLGADLIGFHTYDYARHFLSSVRRLLGYDHSLANVRYKDRLVKVDVFPMGIDFDRYSTSSEDPEVQKEIAQIAESPPAPRLILSVDRLDYTKGIPQRLRAFDRYLNEHSDWRERVSLVLIVAPSRTGVPQYRDLKREIDELVSIINSRHGTMAWTPVHYFYRTFGFAELTALYNLCGVLLVTALRDGMNLVAKEYIAARTTGTGSIVITETAGVAREMSEAIVVNPSDVEQIANGIHTALTMPEDEQRERIAAMQARIERYDIHYWASDFVGKLHGITETQRRLAGRRLQPAAIEAIRTRFSASERRAVILDLDGTLIDYTDRPRRAAPGTEVLALLAGLAKQARILVMSSRDRPFLERIFTNTPVSLMASHGAWIRDREGDWENLSPIDNEWKHDIANVIQLSTDRTPGSRFEEKEYSLAWHYRGSDPDLAGVRLAELRDALLSIVANRNLEVFEGNRVIEIKSSLASKAQAAAVWLERDAPDFTLAAGDDQTDEDLFLSLPGSALSVRVGHGPTEAAYLADSPSQLRLLLRAIAQER